MRRLVIGAAVAVLATVVMVSPGAASPPAGTTIRLVDAGSGLCASPAGGGGALNNGIVQYYCDGRSYPTSRTSSAAEEPLHVA